MRHDPFNVLSDPHGDSAGKPPRRSNRFLGIQFACCSVYARIYVNAQRTAYDGRCPRCGRRVTVPIGPHGTEKRFFTAY